MHVFPGDGKATAIASWSGDGPSLPIGTRFPLDGDNLAARIFESGAPARLHSHDEAWKRAETDLARGLGMRSAVGAPILVEGKLWGALMAATRGVEPWAENAETRIAAFTELVATAIANAEARDALAQLADEQAALRRVATLVARGAPPMDLFGAVAEEVGRLHSVDHAYVTRFDSEETVTVMARWAETGDALPGELPRRFAAGPMSAAVRETRGPVRLDLADALEAGVRSSVAAPITRRGQPVGLHQRGARRTPSSRPRRERRCASRTSAISSRPRSRMPRRPSLPLRAGGSSRRRTRLAGRSSATSTTARSSGSSRSVWRCVRRKRTFLPSGTTSAPQLSGVATGLVAAVEDLQEISRGIHPAILSKGGLGPALQTLAHRSAIPVDLDITTDVRLAEPIEVAAYFVASEALANAAKHSQASRIDVSLEQRDGSLVLSIGDDGVGGADAGRGSGLVGLTDRVEALGGSIHVESRSGDGTQITAELPVEPELPQPAGQQAAAAQRFPVAGMRTAPLDGHP